MEGLQAVPAAISVALGTSGGLVLWVLSFSQHKRSSQDSQSSNLLAWQAGNFFSSCRKDPSF